jgi:hypothetical protein
MTANWETEGSAPNYSKHSLSAVCSSFLPEYNFDLLRLLHPCKLTVTNLYTVTSSCVLVSKHDHVLSYMGHPVAQLVEALRYKPEVHGFDSQWFHWNFSVT